ncbi:hypothetical protein, partial [Frankia sp. ACN1ag]
MPAGYPTGEAVRERTHGRSRTELLKEVERVTEETVAVLVPEIGVTAA